MFYKISKNFIFSKKKGQSLLIILVISTLTMLLLLGVAARINMGRENVRRSGEFDNAFAASENALNDIIAAINSSNCTPANLNTTEYKRITGCDDLENILFNEGADVFAKLNKDTITATVKYPISLLYGDPSSETGSTLSGVKIRCGTQDVLDNRPEVRFIVSMVYFNSSTNEYGILKGVSNCADINNFINPTKGNIQFYDSLSNLILNPSAVNQTQIQNVKLIRLRLLDNSPDSSISIVGKVCDTNGQNCRDEGSTGSYDFMVIGLGGLGSDNIVKFELSRGASNNEIGPLFDFVFFGEDIP